MQNNMKKLRCCLVIIVIFCLRISLGDVNASKSKAIESENKTLNKERHEYLEESDLPDSALMALSHINLRKLAANRYYSMAFSRQSQQDNETESTGTPCSCSYGICKCCTGPVLDLFNQKACMKITYHPGDFAFDVAMSMNDRVLYENSLSGKNPKPMCISPPRISSLKVCAQFSNVFFPGRNIHFCLSMKGRWGNFDLFNMAFDCLRMGANGLAMMKPEENGGLIIPNPQGGVDAVIDSGNEDIEDYDENVVKSLFNIFDDDDEDDDDDDDDDDDEKR